MTPRIPEEIILPSVREGTHSYGPDPGITQRPGGTAVRAEGEPVHLPSMNRPPLDRSILARRRARAEIAREWPRTPPDIRAQFDETLARYLNARERAPRSSRSLLHALGELSDLIRRDLRSDTAEHTFEDLSRIRAYLRLSIADRDARRPFRYRFDPEGYEPYEEQTGALRENLQGTERAIQILRDRLRTEGTAESLRLSARINFEMKYAAGLSTDLESWEIVLAEASEGEIAADERVNHFAEILRYSASVRDRVTGRTQPEEMRAPVIQPDMALTERMRGVAEHLVQALAGEFPPEAVEDFRVRLQRAIDQEDSTWLANLSGDSIREYFGFWGMAEALLANPRGNSNSAARAILRRMQAAQIFAQLGLHGRVREALEGIENPDARLSFQISAIYQGAGMGEEANAVLSRLQTADADTATLALAMAHLNRGEIRDGRALLESIPESEPAREILANLDRGERIRRGLQTVGVLRMIAMDFIQQARDADYRVVDPDQVERETLAAFDEVARRLISGEAESVREAIRQVRGSDAYPHFTLGAWPLDQRATLEESQSAQANFLNEFLNQVDRAGGDEREFSDALFNLGAGLEAYDYFGAAHTLYEQIFLTGPDRHRARERMQGIRTRQRINGHLRVFSIFTSGSDPATSAQNLAMLLGPLALARRAAAAAEGAWVARGGSLVRNPRLLEGVGIGLRIGTEATAFTVSNMALQTLFTGDLNIWNAEHFGREWAAMVVTFALLHGVGAGASRLGFSSGVVPWAGRVGGLTASEYINEAIGFSDDQATPFTARLFLSAVTDAEMILAGRMVNGASGGRLEQAERLNRLRYAQHARRYALGEGAMPMTEGLRRFARGARQSLVNLNWMLLGVAMMTPEGGGSFGQARAGSPSRGGRSVYDATNGELRALEDRLADWALVDYARDPSCPSERWVMEITPESVGRITELPRIFEAPLPEAISRIRVVITEPLNGQSRDLARWAEANRFPMELRVELPLERPTPERIQSVMEGIPSGVPARIFFGGVERISLGNGTGGRSLNFNLRNISAAEAQGILQWVQSLDPALLQGANLQLRDLPEALVRDPNIRARLAELARLTWERRAQSLLIEFEGQRRFFGLRRNSDSRGPTYFLDSPMAVREVRDILAPYLAWETARILQGQNRSASRVPDGEALVRMWEAALDHAEGFSRLEVENYGPYWSHDSSVSRWVRALQNMANFAGNGGANFDSVRDVVNRVLEFSQPGETRGLLGHAPFEGRALADNAFELMRIFLEVPGGDLPATLNTIRRMGREQNTEVLGAFLGLVYKVAMGNLAASRGGQRDFPAEREVQTLLDQRNMAIRLGRRARFIVIPEDRNGRDTTPEWILEFQDADGRRILLASEVKAINWRDNQGSASNQIAKATRQLTQHPFIGGEAERAGLMTLWLSQVARPEQALEGIQRILALEYRRRLESRDPAERASAEAMRRIPVMVYLTPERGGSPSATLLTFRGEAWVVEMQENGVDRGTRGNFLDPILRVLRRR